MAEILSDNNMYSAISQLFKIANSSEGNVEWSIVVDNGTIRIHTEHQEGSCRIEYLPDSHISAAFHNHPDHDHAAISDGDFYSLWDIYRSHSYMGNWKNFVYGIVTRKRLTMIKIANREKFEEYMNAFNGDKTAIKHRYYYSVIDKYKNEDPHTQVNIMNSFLNLIGLECYEGVFRTTDTNNGLNLMWYDPSLKQQKEFKCSDLLK